MKKIILSLIFLAIIYLPFTFSQNCCPYLDNVELFPAQPNEVDSIHLILKVTTPGQGNFLGYQFTETDSLTTVEACYFSGPLAALQTYEDTLNLGVHPSGDFNVKFIAWISGNDTICNYAQNQSMDLTIDIEPSNAVFSPLEMDISIFPNPIRNQNLMLQSDIDFQQIKIYNQQGMLVLAQHNLKDKLLTLKIDHLPKGIYFLNGSLLTGAFFSHKIIKE